MRLDQFLVKNNICSRSEGKQYVKKGRVTVDGKVVRDSSLHIDEHNSVVKFDGRVIAYEEFSYLMLNKPKDCVSATKDGLSSTVIDLLGADAIPGLFPVGRLDKDTEGLLLITNDGQLAHRLLSPRHHVDKVYYVVADREITDEDMIKMEQGLDIGDDKPTLPATVKKVNFVPEGREGYSYELTIHEGRFHQVKRMFEACGSKVIYLKRLTMGSLRLDDKLLPGEYRKLYAEELTELINSSK